LIPDTRDICTVVHRHVVSKILLVNLHEARGYNIVGVILSLSVCLSVRLSVCLSIRLSVCLSGRARLLKIVCNNVHEFLGWEVSIVRYVNSIRF